MYLHGPLDDVMSAYDGVQQLSSSLLCQVTPVAHQRRQLAAAVAATPAQMGGLRKGDGWMGGWMAVAGVVRTDGHAASRRHLADSSHLPALLLGSFSCGYGIVNC